MNRNQISKKPATAMNAMQSNDKRISRNSFFRLLVKGSLAVSAVFGMDMLIRYLGFNNGSNPPTQKDLGEASDYPVDSRTPVQAAGVLVIHDNQGYSAISLVCPHLGCTVNITVEGFACPCHGSRFYPDGSLLAGPASNSLAKIPIVVDPAGRLILVSE